MGRKLQPGIDKIPESWVKKQVKDILSKYPNLKYDMPPASQYGNAGRHDFIICQRGLFWTIETKAGKNTKPTALQISYAEEIEAAGGMCLLVNEFTYEAHVKDVADYIAYQGHLPTLISTNFRTAVLPTRLKNVS